MDVVNTYVQDSLTITVVIGKIIHGSLYLRGHTIIQEVVGGMMMIGSSIIYGN